MKAIFVGVSIIAVTAFASTQTPAQTTEQPQQSGQSLSPQQEQQIKEVRKANTDFFQAIKQKDAGTVGKRVADEAVFSGTGPLQVDSKDSFLKMILSPEFKIKSITLGEVVVKWQSQTVVVIGNATFEEQADGETSKQRLNFMNVFAKRIGRWQLIVSYTSAEASS